MVLTAYDLTFTNFELDDNQDTCREEISDAKLRQKNEIAEKYCIM